MEDQNINGVGVEGTAPEENPTSNQSQTDQTSLQPDDDQTLPQDDSQREAFIKMRQKIKELEGQLSQRDDELDLVNLARGVTENDFVPEESEDPTQAILNRVQTAELLARQAEARASARIEDFEAWQEYPFLRPGTQRTPEQDLFLDDVKSRYVAEQLKARSEGKRAPTLLDIAKKVDKAHQTLRGAVVQQERQQAQKIESQKMVASVESAGTTINVAPSTNQDRIEELRMRVRRGDTAALSELNSLIDPFISSL